MSNTGLQYNIESFSTDVQNAFTKIEEIYETLVNADTKFSTINDYYGSYQAALADSWSTNYSIAVQGLSDMRNAVALASTAGSNIAGTDQQIANGR